MKPEPWRVVLVLSQMSLEGRSVVDEWRWASRGCQRIFLKIKRRGVVGITRRTVPMMERAESGAAFGDRANSPSESAVEQE